MRTRRAFAGLSSEVQIFGDYLTEGWRMWAFVVGTVTIGFFGLALLVVFSGS
jgi:hypothetical protein